MQRAGLMLVLFAAASALAHPGHESGWLSASLAHLLSEPDHLAMILAPVVVGLCWTVQRRVRR